MAATITANGCAERAAGILRDIFGAMDDGLTFRLWDGTELCVGRNILPITIAFSSLSVFKRLLLKPTAGNFGEAYIESEIDLEGDLFAAMNVAGSFDEMNHSLWQRLRLGLRIWMLSE